jgi:hypothetical protein
MPSSDGYEAFVSAVMGNRASLLWPLWAVTVSWPNRVSGVDNTELDNGQLVRSRRREYSCGRRWRSGVTASYGRDTDEDEVQWSEELTVMGRRTRKALCTTLYVRVCNKEKLSKSFDRSWVYFLARSWGLGGYGYGLRTDKRWMTFPHGLFENLDCSRKLLLLLLIWSEKSWLLKGRLAWRQGIKPTGIIKRPLRKKEG